VSKKSNVHPDYYKTAGRDRQDDAAAARLVRAIAAKVSSRERPDRVSMGPYFQRLERAGPRGTNPQPASPRDRGDSPPRPPGRKRATSSAPPASRAAKKTAVSSTGKRPAKRPAKRR
jgi:hypothetical protein